MAFPTTSTKSGSIHETAGSFPRAARCMKVSWNHGHGSWFLNQAIDPPCRSA